MSCTAVSRSASGQTIIDALPPSSMSAGVSARPAALMIDRAVTVPPVKVIFATRGSATSAAPASGPKPVTTLSVPGGSRSSTIAANSRTLADAYSDGLTTSVLPVASAGAILLASVMIGEFQGISAAMTPSGSRRV
jgi:hypothetical protein